MAEQIQAGKRQRELFIKKSTRVAASYFPLFLRQRGQNGGKISVCEDNPLTAYHNRVLLVGVYEICV